MRWHLYTHGVHAGAGGAGGGQRPQNSIALAESESVLPLAPTHWRSTGCVAVALRYRPPDLDHCLILLYTMCTAQADDAPCVAGVTLLRGVRRCLCLGLVVHAVGIVASSAAGQMSTPQTQVVAAGAAGLSVRHSSSHALALRRRRSWTSTVGSWWWSRCVRRLRLAKCTGEDY